MGLYTAVVQGVLIGGLYAAAALALSLIFGSLKVVNLAHGELVVGGAYLTYALTGATGWSTFEVLPLTMVVMAVVGFAVYRGLLDRLARRGPSGPLIATFGLSLVAQALFAAAYTDDPRVLPGQFASTGLGLLGVRVQESYLIALLISAAVALLVHLGLSRTRAGAAVRAAATDPVTTELMGVNVRRLQAIVFGVAAAIAAIGGVMVGISVSFTPSSGTSLLVIGFAVVVLGGLGNVVGTFAAALLVGVVQSLTAFSLGGGLRDLAVYVVLLAVLALRPEGLFTRRVRFTRRGRAGAQAGSYPTGGDAAVGATS